MTSPGMDVLHHDTFLRQCAQSEEALRDPRFDFSAKYMAVSHLGSLVRSHPETIRSHTLEVLEKTLKDPSLSGQTQAYFLYKNAAETLCAFMTRTGFLSHVTRATLEKLLFSLHGRGHRAFAETLGTLPLNIKGPRIPVPMPENIPEADPEAFFRQVNPATRGAPRLMGRSWITPLEQGNRVLVLKMDPAPEAWRLLLHEAVWMTYLRTRMDAGSLRFHIPDPIPYRDSLVFRLNAFPAGWPHGRGAAAKPFAICFLAHRDYYAYPNEASRKKGLPPCEFKDVMTRNARLLGRLTARGILHTAILPLFHNRIQGHRRADHGVYEWWREGRLDRWLSSCAYPNFGVSGLRDFEHVVGHDGSHQTLYRRMGSHFLGLLLVAGSYFRNRDTHRVGWHTDGRAVDARDLFDPALFQELISGIFSGYYRGFVGTPFEGDLCGTIKILANRMIEEMGVDRHMEEVLRVADQKEMTGEAFMAFLATHGRDGNPSRTPEKGEKDILVKTGPHLGGFNDRISLPELIESVATMTALCILGRRMRQENKGGLKTHGG